MVGDGAGHSAQAFGLLKLPVLGFEFRPLHLDPEPVRTFQQCPIQPVGIDRLGHIFVHADFNRLLQIACLLECGGDDDRNGGIHFTDLAGHGQAVHTRQLDIRDDESRLVGPESRLPFHTVFGGDQLPRPFLQKPGKLCPCVRIIFHIQEGKFF